MAFPWTMSTERAYTIAGASATIDELLQGINDLVVAEGTLWEVSALSIVNHTLELKRKVSGSPAGEYASVRVLFFGSSSPNSAALIPSGAAPAANTLYCCMSIDAATTGPGTAFTAGAPYSTKFLQGDVVCTSSDFQAASGARITMIESTEGICFCFNEQSSTSIASTMSGKLLITGADGTYKWCNITSGGVFTSSSTPNLLLTGMAATPFFVPGYSDTATHAGKPSYYTGSAVRQFGRHSCTASFAASLAQHALGSSGALCALNDIPVAESSQAATQTEAIYGKLRQIKIGPVSSHRKVMTTTGPVTVARHFHGSGTEGLGIWFDETE
jgi:hypothetical protein